MILHIGENDFIYQEDIIAILDKKSAEASNKTREFVSKLIDEGSIIGNIDEHTKSYILVSGGKNNQKIYTSNISSKALVKRNISNI